MDEFIKLVRELEHSNIPYAEYLKDHELIHNISNLAVVLLITEQGDCNWDNIMMSRNNGIDIFPLEQDRFGWLIGGIQTEKGIIQYG